MDHCEQRASAAWNELTGNSKGLSAKVGVNFILTKSFKTCLPFLCVDNGI